ncbi:AP2 domain transcription factor AP2X-9 [Toxoplasma gondii VAND]|uniref:AP2 domain transcription factor AP2X-9 n=1 Tax=Toxoplasma gondii VAND TaxID=933077 RepID=A0A086Q5R1_TOXGO|nr:AP2 domain transcription factor AP2X-9 [Toxoplasma gondii VAND]
MSFPSKQPLCGGDPLASAVVSQAKDMSLLGLPSSSISNVVTRGNSLSFSSSADEMASSVSDKCRTASIVSDISTAPATSRAPSRMPSISSACNATLSGLVAPKSDASSPADSHDGDKAKDAALLTGQLGELPVHSGAPSSGGDLVGQSDEIRHCQEFPAHVSLEKTEAEVPSDSVSNAFRKTCGSAPPGFKGLESPMSCRASSLSTTTPECCGPEVGFGTQDEGSCFFSNDPVCSQRAIPLAGNAEPLVGLVKEAAARGTSAVSGSGSEQLSSAAVQTLQTEGAENLPQVHANRRSTSGGSEADSSLEMMLMMLTPLVAPASKGGVHSRQEMSSSPEVRERSASLPAGAEGSALVAKAVVATPFSTQTLETSSRSAEVQPEGSNFATPLNRPNWFPVSIADTSASADGDRAASAPGRAADANSAGLCDSRRTTETYVVDSLSSSDSNEERHRAGVASLGQVSGGSTSLLLPSNGPQAGTVPAELMSVHSEVADVEKVTGLSPLRQARGEWTRKESMASSEQSAAAPAGQWSDAVSLPQQASVIAGRSSVSLSVAGLTASGSPAAPSSLSSSPELPEVASPPLSNASLRSPGAALPPPVPPDLAAVELPAAPVSDALFEEAASAETRGSVAIPHQLLVDLQLLLLLLFEHACQLLPPLKRQDEGQFYAWHVQRLAAKAQATLFHYADLMAPLCTSSLFSQCQKKAEGPSAASASDAADSAQQAPMQTEDDGGFPHETAAAALEVLELCAQGRGNEKSAGWSLLALLLLQGLPPNASIFLSVSKCPVGRFLKVVGSLERAYSLYKMVQGNGGERRVSTGVEQVVSGGDSFIGPLAGLDSDGVFQAGGAGALSTKAASACSSRLVSPQGLSGGKQNGPHEPSHATLSPSSGSVSGQRFGVSEAASLTGVSPSFDLEEGALLSSQRRTGNGESAADSAVTQNAARTYFSPQRVKPEKKVEAQTEGDAAPAVTFDQGPRGAPTERETGAAGGEEALATLLERQPLLQSDFASELFPGAVAVKGANHKEDFYSNASSWQAALASAFSSPLCHQDSANQLARSGFPLPPADACAPGCGVAESTGADRCCRDPAQTQELAGSCLPLFGHSRGSKRGQKDLSVPADAVHFGTAPPALVQPAKKGALGSGSGSRKSQKKLGSASTGSAASPASSLQGTQEGRSCAGGVNAGVYSFDSSLSDASSRLSPCGDLYLSASVNKRRHPSVQAEILKNCCTETLAERGTRLLDEVLQKLQNGGLQASQPSGSAKEERVAVSGGDGDRHMSESSRSSSQDDETNASSRRSRRSASDLAPLAACVQTRGSDIFSGDGTGWWGSESALREPPAKCRRTVGNARAAADTPGNAVNGSCEEQLLTLLRNATPTCTKGDLSLGLGVLSPGKGEFLASASDDSRLGGASAVSELIKKTALGSKAGGDLEFQQTAVAKAQGATRLECKKTGQFAGPLAGEQRVLLALNQAGGASKAFAPESLEAAATAGEGRKKRGAASNSAGPAHAAPNGKAGTQLPGLLLDRGASGAFGNSAGAIKSENGRTTNRLPVGARVEAASNTAAAIAAAGQDETMRGVFFNRSLNRWVCTWSRNGKEYQRSWSAGKYGYEAARQLARQCRLEKLLSGEAHTLQKGMAAVFKAPVGAAAFPASGLVVSGPQSPPKETGRQTPQPAKFPDSASQAAPTERVEGRPHLQRLPQESVQEKEMSGSGGAERGSATVETFESSPEQSASQNSDVLSLDRCCRLLLEQELAVALGDVHALCAEASVAKGNEERKVKKVRDRGDEGLLSLMAMQPEGGIVARKNSPGKKSAPTAAAGGNRDFGQMVMLMNACVERDHPCFEVSSGSSSSNSFPAGGAGDFTFAGNSGTQAEQVCFHDLT